MAFRFEAEPTVKQRRCDHCGEEHAATSGLVTRDDQAFAAYWADWYPHEDEAWLDVTLGSWADLEDPDHVTFGCRIGHVDGQDEPACSLVPGAEIRGDLPIFGHKLTRDEALVHPWVDAFWELADWLIENDPMLHEHVFHMPSA